MTEPRPGEFEPAIDRRPIFENGFYEGRFVTVGFDKEFELRKVKFAGDISLGKVIAIMRQLNVLPRFKKAMEGTGPSDHMMLDIEITYPEPYPHLARTSIKSGDISRLFGVPASPLQIEIFFDQKERKLIVRGSPR